jgi:hypothetical protein
MKTYPTQSIRNALTYLLCLCRSAWTLTSSGHGTSHVKDCLASFPGGSIDITNGRLGVLNLTDVCDASKELWNG